MALDVKYREIIGEIDNLEKKLNGELPINRVELLYLVNSWGRNQEFSTNENIRIPKCEATQCYNLSKLDTSEITNMSDLFTYSLFNGDISNWNTSNVTDMSYMFYNATKFNSPLNNWNVSDVKNMISMFDEAIEFNQSLDKWDIFNVKKMHFMFYEAKAFENKFNNGKFLSSKIEDLKEWFVENRDIMMALNINNNDKKELDNYFENIINENNLKLNKK